MEETACAFCLVPGFRLVGKGVLIHGDKVNAGDLRETQGEAWWWNELAVAVICWTVWNSNPMGVLQ